MKMEKMIILIYLKLVMVFQDHKKLFWIKNKNKIVNIVILMENIYQIANIPEKNIKIYNTSGNIKMNIKQNILIGQKK